MSNSNPLRNDTASLSDTSNHRIYSVVLEKTSLYATPHPSHFTLHPLLFTLYSSLFTLHPSLFTLHPSPLTLHSSLFTLHSSLLTLQVLTDQGRVANIIMGTLREGKLRRKQDMDVVGFGALNVAKEKARYGRGGIWGLERGSNL